MLGFSGVLCCHLKPLRHNVGYSFSLYLICVLCVKRHKWWTQNESKAILEFSFEISIAKAYHGELWFRCSVEKKTTTCHESVTSVLKSFKMNLQRDAAFKEKKKKTCESKWGGAETFEFKYAIIVFISWNNTACCSVIYIFKCIVMLYLVLFVEFCDVMFCFVLYIWLVINDALD